MSMEKDYTSISSTAAPTCVLVTGITGFVGKVIVEEILRRFQGEQRPQIIVVIRPKKGKPGTQRFLEDVASSQCYSELEPDWPSYVAVVEGDLGSPLFGMTEETLQILGNTVTHIIHCAASVEFGLSLRETTTNNVQSAMRVMDVAQRCPLLQRMVYVSTAYTGHFSQGHIPEQLRSLPYEPEELYRMIQEMDVDEEAILKECAQNNTYTLSKTISEHMLNKRRGNLPLTIVRPSIISASWKYPFPGWIDSRAALAGFIALTGSGYLHVIEGKQDTIFDVVPVDFVANSCIDEVRLLDPPMELPHPAPTPTRVVNAVSTPAQGCPAPLVLQVTLKYFRAHQVERRPMWRYLGPKGTKYYFHKITSQKLPFFIARCIYKTTGNKPMQKKLKFLNRSISKVNSGFRDFSQNTFNFDCAKTLGPEFDAEEYLGIVCAGIHRHLMAPKDAAGTKNKPPQAKLTAPKGIGTSTGGAAVSA